MSDKPKQVKHNYEKIMCEMLSIREKMLLYRQMLDMTFDGLEVEEIFVKLLPKFGTMERRSMATLIEHFLTKLPPGGDVS